MVISAFQVTGVAFIFSVSVYIWHSRPSGNLCNEQNREILMHNAYDLDGGGLIFGGWGVVEWGRKSYLGPAEIASISSQDLSQSNEHDTFWYVVLTGYFYIFFSWAIALLDFLPLEIYKSLGLPLSSIDFKVNSYKDNHFYKYICFKYYIVLNHFQRFLTWTL